MAKQLQLRRGTTVQHATFTGAVGEVTIDTDKDVVVVHDGATAGGFPSQKQLVSGTNIKTINNTSLLGSGDISIIQTISVANIDEMKDFVASYDNYALNVLGYLEAGDGGGGTFYYDANSTEDDNGGTIIEPTSGSGRWVRVCDFVKLEYFGVESPDYVLDSNWTWDSTVDKSTANLGTIIDPSVALDAQGTGSGFGCMVRQYEGAVNVKWFGAKGDGVTDDTTAIQRALDINQYNGTLFIDEGVYLFSSLIIPKYTTIIGGGLGNTKLLSSTTGVALKLGDDTTIPDGDFGYSGATLEKFTLEKLNRDKIGTGIWSYKAVRTSFRDLKIVGFNIGMDMSSTSWSSTIERCWIRSNTYGIFLGHRDENYKEPDETGWTGLDSGTGFNGGLITGCEIQGNTWGIFGKKYANIGNLGTGVGLNLNVTIDANVIEGNTKQAIVYSDRMYGTTVSNNYFELNCTDASIIDPSTITIDTNTDWLTLSGDIVSDTITVRRDIAIIGNSSFNSASYMLVTSYGSVTFNGNYGSKGVYSRQPTVNYQEGKYTLKGNLFTVGRSLDIDRAVRINADGRNGRSVPTFAGTWTYGTSVLYMFKQDGIINISGSVTGGALANGNIFTLPENYRPISRVETTIQNMFKGSIHNLRIDTTGEALYIHTEYIGIQRNTTSDVYYMNVTFPCVEKTI